MRAVSSPERQGDEGEGQERGGLKALRCATHYNNATLRAAATAPASTGSHDHSFGEHFGYLGLFIILSETIARQR